MDSVPVVFTRGVAFTVAPFPEQDAFYNNKDRKEDKDEVLEREPDDKVPLSAMPFTGSCIVCALCGK